MKSVESLEQQTLMQWAAMHLKKYPELKLLHHIPNGGYRNIATATRLKREGVRAGVPDLSLPVPKGKWHGLYIELKAANGKLSEKQIWWIEQLRQQGYYVAVCYGWEQAKETIVRYLKGE